MKCKNCGGNIPTSQRERAKDDCICTNPAPYSADFYSTKEQLDRIEKIVLEMAKKILGEE